LDSAKLPKIRVEYLIPAAGCLSLLISCVVVSDKRYLWLDELYSWLLLNDPSLPRMVGALADQADTSPPLYYLVGWLWVQVFGGHALSLRLLSSVGLCVALVLTWILLRRVYEIRAAAVGVLTVFGTSHLVLIHNSDARSYGLYTALVATGCLVYLATSEYQQMRWRWFIATALVHGALVLVHTYGALYSCALLGAMLLLDLYRRRFRPTAYVAVAVGWLAFTPWLRPYLHQVDVSRPRSWMPTPSVLDLIGSFSFGLFLLPIIVLVVVIGGVLQPTTETASAPKWDAQRSPERIALIILAGALLTIPLASFVVSRVVLSIFYDRYFVPSVIAWAIVLAEIVTAVTRARPVSANGNPIREIGSGSAALCLGLVLFPLFFALTRPRMPMPGEALAEMGLQGIPVVAESPLEFLPGHHYSAQTGIEYYYVLDWPAALAGARNATVDYKMMRAVNRTRGVERVVDAAQFLCLHPRFVVLDRTDMQWYELRLRDHPSMATQRLGEVGGMEVILVEQAGGAQRTGSCDSLPPLSAQVRPGPDVQALIGP
jgi:hypothetical protein